MQYVLFYGHFRKNNCIGSLHNAVFCFMEILGQVIAVAYSFAVFCFTVQMASKGDQGEGQKLGTVTGSKYLGAVVSDDG